jgi:GntR family transcriptional regulator/MocR family aminotransferase
VFGLTSSELDTLIVVQRDSSTSLGRQLEDQLRDAVRRGALAAGSVLPSTRDLARQLGISRPLVGNAYSQLAAEGFVVLRQGALPRIAASSTPARAPTLADTAQAPAPQFDFLPSVPDLGSFPRNAWMRAYRKALEQMVDEDFGYRNAHGVPALRQALAEYLGRVRGVIGHPDQIVITSGFAQARVLVGRMLRALGASCVAVENPGYTNLEPITSVGLRVSPIPVDADGLQTELLGGTDADALMVTPAHHFPTGAVLSGARRTLLLQWLRSRDAIVLEDDYDSEFRYDRSPVGALQGLEPDRVLYAGTSSKTLAPALRLGWLVVPPRFVELIRQQQSQSDLGCSRLDQQTLAELIRSGDFDRHVRRMRSQYRARRDALLEALRTHIPEAHVTGIAAGVHVALELRPTDDEAAIQRAALSRGVAVGALQEHLLGERLKLAPTLLVGYGRHSEAAIRAGVRALATSIHATRSRNSNTNKTSGSI